MTNDVSRVYQFLAKTEDWQVKADKNGDGTIIKSEFRTFMEENFEWNGEEVNEKNDLINSFWKTIDTNKSGNVSGTKLKNLNALDSKEIDKMNNKIEIYEVLNTYLTSVNAPNEVNNKGQWKKSVSESLGNYTTTFIEKGGKAEDLAAYLDTVRTQVENKTTANLCAQEYIAEAMADIVKEYGYNSLADSTLNGMIDSYVKNLPEGETPSTIQQTIQVIVDAYMSTAGVGDGDVSMLKDYGYAPNPNSPLNDLQKTIAEKKLKTAMKELEKEADYEANKDLYEKAITDFITKTLDGAKFKDFEAITQYTVDDFKNHEAGKNLAQTIQVKNLFASEELNGAIRTKIGDSVADLVTKDGKYLKVMQDIQATTLEKAQNGDFNKADGTLDTQKVLDYIVDQIQANIAKFYSNGLGGLSLEELNNVYDAMVKAANNESDTDKSLSMYKDAAIKYCTALSQKSSAFANAVKDVFGDDYASAINSSDMRPSMIDAKIAELRAMVADLNDVTAIAKSGSADALWKGIETSYSIKTGERKPINLPDSFDYNGKTISPVEYKSSNDDVVIENGKIFSTKPGKHQTTIVAYVDGIKVSQKTITVTVAESFDAIVNRTTDTTLGLSGICDWNSDQNFKDLYIGDKNIILYGKTNSMNKKHKWSAVKPTITSRLLNLGNDVAKTLATAGLDIQILNKAVNTVVNNYISRDPKEYTKDKGGSGKDDMINKGNTKMLENREASASRIVRTKDTDGLVSSIYQIHFKDFVDDILAEYQRLAS